nr:hypothetical protein [Aphanizomenon sp. UHCC 0183]
MGGVESLLCYPSKMTHGSLPETERLKRGIRDFQEINYPKKRTTEAQSTQRENFCISFGTFFYLEVS